MACFAPSYYLVERTLPDGTQGLLVQPDLATALAEAVVAARDGAWSVDRISQGRDFVLEGEALATAIAEAAARIAA
jgi:hypothetical protein